MRDHSVHALNSRSVSKGWLFFPLWLVALASLLFTPLIEARQSLGRTRTSAFRGIHANAVLARETARLTNSDERHPSVLPQPVPIPGGILVPPLIHVFAPGPLALGFQGLDVEPSVITNFHGFSAIGYPTGTNAARDSNGNLYDVVTDLRVFQGEYVAADGTHHRGTFVFI